MFVGPIRTTVDWATGSGIFCQDFESGVVLDGWSRFHMSMWDRVVLTLDGFSSGSVMCGWALFFVMGYLAYIVLTTVFFVVFSDF